MSDESHQLRVIELGDSPDAWRSAGFDVVDADADGAGRGHVRLGTTTVVLTGRGGDPAWSIDGVVAPIDGLPIAIVDIDGATSTTMSAVPHPNGISRIDHVVVRTGDCDRTAAAFAAAGMAPRRTRDVTDGPTPVRQIFCWAGDVIVEIVGPVVATGGAPATATFFGLALVADDLDATAARLGDVLGSPRDAVQPGRRIASLRHRAAEISLPVAVMSPHP